MKYSKVWNHYGYKDKNKHPYGVTYYVKEFAFVAYKNENVYYGDYMIKFKPSLTL